MNKLHGFEQKYVVWRGIAHDLVDFHTFSEVKVCPGQYSDRHLQGLLDRYVRLYLIKQASEARPLQSRFSKFGTVPKNTMSCIPSGWKNEKS